MHWTLVYLRISCFHPSENNLAWGFVIVKKTFLLLLVNMPDKNVMKLKPVWGPWLSKTPT
jgi:hypothetical protein